MGSLRNNKYYSGFDPRSIPGCDVWYDAADSNAVVLSGSSVTQWSDKSGNNKHLTAYGGPTYTTLLNGNRTITTNGSTSYLESATYSLAQPFTVFVVCALRYSQNSSAYYVFEGTTGTGNAVILYFSAGVLMWAGGTTSYTSPAILYSTTPRMYSAVFNGSSSSLGVNGVITTGLNPGTNSKTGLRFGRAWENSFQEGDWAEVIIYNRSLTDLQRQQIEGYLSWKWGLIPRFQNPTSISGLALWLDGADTRSVGVSGTSVTAWNDKSGLNNNLTTISTIRPTYSSNTGAITFTSGNGTSIRGSLNTTYSAATSLFVVASVRLDASAVAYPRFVEIGVLGSPNLTFAGQLNVVINQNTGSTPAFSVYANTNNNPTGQGTNLQTYVPTTFGTVGLYENISSYSSPTLTLNTFLTGNTSTYSARTTSWTVASPYTTNYSYISLGNYISGAAVGGDAFSGDMYEVILFSRALTTTERQQIEGYLADKWGLRANLPGSFPALFPTSHPFYRSLPYTRAFNPLDVAGCSLWLDGADGGSMTLSGSNITAWRDKSGLGSNATASGTPVLLQNALASNSVVYFNGSSYFTGSQSDTNNTHSVLAVVSFNSGGPQYARLASFGVNGQFDYSSASYYNLSSNTSQFAITRNFTETDVAGLTSDVYHIVTAIFNGTNGLYYVDGGMSSNSAAWTSNFNFNQYRIGADQIPTTAQQLQGYVGELITYSNALSTTERLQLERYLGWKWNISNQISQPTDIGGVSLWLDAADPNSLTLSGTSVTTWKDKSGNGRNATGGVSPSYSNNGVVFNGSSTYLATTYSAVPSSESVFVVVTWTGTVDRNYCILGTSATNGRNYNVFKNAGSNVIKWDKWGVAGYAETPGVQSNVRFLSTGLFNGTSGTTNLNGGSPTGPVSFSFSGAGTTNIGTGVLSDYYQGTINEIVCYSNVVSSTQRQQVEKYLARKWGLTASVTVPSSILSLDIPPRTTVLEPPQLSNLSLWLDAADSGRVSLSGSNIAAWIDKSSNGLSMTGTTPPTYVSNALNGLPTVSFTTAQSLSSTSAMTLSPSNTWALVFNSSTGGNFFMVEHSSNINLVQGSYFLGVNWDLYAMNRTGSISTWKRYQDTIGQNIPPFSSNTWYIAIVSDNNLNGGVFFRRNGTTRSLVNVNSYISLTGNITSNFFINHRFSADVNFGEILVYNRGLTLPEVQSLEGYLANKWGLRSSLPSSHPYVKETP